MGEEDEDRETETTVMGTAATFDACRTGPCYIVEGDPPGVMTALLRRGE